MKVRGKAFRFGDDVSTDNIISGRYKHAATDMAELSVHCLEDLDPEFSKKAAGGVVVAGKTFGCGSSRETAPRVLIGAGAVAVVAKSFARIFYRNAINTGLPIAECDTDGIEAGHDVEVDLIAGKVIDHTAGKELAIKPLPSAMVAILKDGGLKGHFAKHGKFQVEV